MLFIHGSRGKPVASTATPPEHRTQVKSNGKGRGLGSSGVKQAPRRLLQKKLERAVEREARSLNLAPRFRTRVFQVIDRGNGIVHRFTLRQKV